MSEPYIRYEPCTDCNGTGHDIDGPLGYCPYCFDGYVSVYYYDGDLDPVDDELLYEDG